MKYIRKLRGKIFIKLFLSYAGIMLASFVLFAGVFIFLFHLQLYDQFEEEFSYHHEHLEQQWPVEDERLAEEMLTQSKSEVLIYSDCTSCEPFYWNEEVLTEAQSGEIAHDSMWLEDGELVHVVAAPFQDDDVMLMAFYDLNHEYTQLAVMLLTPFVITLMIMTVIVWAISRKITAPLKELNDVALKLAEGDFSKKAKPKSNDEIAQLGETFNYMAEELESLEDMRRDFIANVSHDLRSPLTSIKGFLVALIDDTIPNNERTHYYHIMKDETERLIKLVNDLLDMTQLQSGTVKIHKSRYDISEQVRQIVARMEPQFNEKELEVDLSLEEVEINADKDRIDQLLVNLIQNALQFSKANTTVSIQTKIVENGVAISVTDEGEGIRQEDLKMIFERFYKSDTSRSSKVGTGIGLSIVQSIADLHDAKVDVTSQQGKGTTFSVTLLNK
ncbi:HAMP domain-containing sensor histidine kinase [Alkalibacillus haloalkaliphilus]|uniref:HAMP domain-containing sensor histidine kinase n=1 Tax=Alkalibacillus haloalkaliphilus TaxID=94136 RepID=UPI0029369828|nr:HAMP domain-containing sensor histidine kinase [Alkalibacillus haloalkaliphilus]MDV2581474.1 HAMP domain-containing sensor histidine kinase [Alkalibacillus haloalkaliphilus]